MTSARAQLVRLLGEVLDEAFRSRIERTDEARVQLTLHGLPNDLLRDLFAELTDDGKRNLPVRDRKGHSRRSGPAGHS